MHWVKYMMLSMLGYTPSRQQIVHQVVLHMPVQREIMSVMQYPEFDIITANTNCNENIGSASIKVSGNVEVKEIEWEIQGAIEVGPQASALPSGVFTVTAISFKNCRTLEDL